MHEGSGAVLGASIDIGATPEQVLYAVLVGGSDCL
jgi:hypothetical protein